ncbi:hypothetical protein CI238_02986 [Colletotrichum incanum]|uniref:Uncharacterized protein n=1 Tax=Colletotrichum incanum TaxID=1573173 RepID=A0A167EHX7_COLIC|nr:hypothetical protein CI238_02986 [Colletotrichum incanum]
MENVHAQRRSVSHGSLRSSYKSHDRLNVGHNLLRRPPLRSVNENASLLPSPGPLESMLKTTTETGDIGIFSIKPVAPATTIHHYARSRSGLDVGSIFGTDPAASDGTVPRAERRRRGSACDTNLEIFSMYGSEGPPSSLPSSLSPRNDRMCQRSYSLNNCGSRHLSSHISSGTLQSQSSSGILQRPRSPFPYPTRLKRLGVRPSSPALTENGLVDYSRMVEIDRISYRTVHGSYKPTFPQPQRLVPPLAFRPGVNQSMPSLPYPTSLVSPTESIVRDRGYKDWDIGPLNRTRRPSTNQSVRSSSLTSVIEMYCRPPSTSDSNLQRTIRPAGSFYYDYTEGFESPDPQADHSDSMAAPPLAPIPQRASSLVKALVLRDENNARLDAVVDVSIKDSSDSSGDDGRVPTSNTVDDIETLPSQRMNCRTAPPTLEPFPFETDETSAACPVDFGTATSIFKAFSSCVDAEEMPPSLTAQAALSSTARQAVDAGNMSDEEQPHAEKKILKDGEPAAETDRSPLHNVADRQIDKGSQNHSESLEVAVPDHGETQEPPHTLITREHALRRMSSHGSLATMLRSSLRHSVDPALSDLAALVSSFERIAKSPFMRKDNELSGPSATADKAGFQRPQKPEVEPVETNTATDDGTAANAGAHTVLQSKKPFYKGHRRNQALAPISMTSLQVQRTASVSSAVLPLPAPESVSAMNASRVRNGVPQLMKVLPKLPNDAPVPAREVPEASVDDFGFPVKFSPFQLEIMTTPRSSPRITAHPNVGDHESFRASIELELAPAGKAQPLTEGTATVGGLEVSENIDAAGQPHKKLTGKSQGHQEEPSPSRRRLRLRAPRPGGTADTTCFPECQNGTSILTELPTHPAEDMLSSVPRGGLRSSTAYRRRGRQFILFVPDGQGDGENHLARFSPTARVSRDGHLHECDIPLAHPVDANLLRQSTSTDGFDLSDSRSSSPEYTFIRPQILRKKLSNMKIRLTKSRLNFRDHVNKTMERQARQHGAIGSTDSDNTIIHDQRSTVPRNQSRQMGRQMRRWIRRAVRVCVKGRRGEGKPAV